jgi:S1-C subfamily serine protease
LGGLRVTQKPGAAVPIDVNRPGENEAPGISNRLVPILLALIAASLAPSSRADKPPPPSTGAADDFPAPPGTSPAPPPSSPSRPDPEPDFVIAARAAAAASAKVIAPPERVMTTADIVDESERSVALIKGKSSSGTGFLVAPGLLVTNAHVIANERISDLEVRFPSADGPNKGPSAVELMDEDRSRDLAILAIRSKLPPLRVAPAYRYRKGEDVTVIGNPGLGVIGNPGLGDGE